MAHAAHLHFHAGTAPALAHPFAIGAWLAGAHDNKIVPLILYDSPSYYRTLSFARAGEIPFFILACLMVWFWTRRLHGDLAAAAAVLLFTNLPPVLAHAGLATTDIALCGTLMAALYAFESGKVILLGLAVAAGILTKFSFLLYFPVCLAVMFVLGDRKEYLSRFRARPLAIAILTCVLIVWATNFFSFAPLMQGLPDLRRHNRFGHPSYLFGDLRTHGWWYFFPVAFAYKTPIAFLALLLIACYFLRHGPRRHWIPLVCALAIIASAMPSHIDIGVRHILPVYALLAIPAGMAAASAPRIVAGLLVLWLVVVSVRAHPDYIAYFNEFARGRPELIRVDSDLDWGQDCQRLARYLSDRGIKQASFRMFGNLDPSRHGLANYQLASPWEPSTGWIAVSATERYLSLIEPPIGTHAKPWAWLDPYQPVDRIDGAVLIYRIPP